MTVLGELLAWSVSRPDWQRDALRRLVRKGELANEDIEELAEVCKAAHGLADQREPRPLAGEDLPNLGRVGAPVSLTSIYHHRGVNALAEGQTLTLAPSLTVVYGDNAAGKTGYIRILKSACRARGREKILGNVVSGATPLSPVVAIKYRVGDEEDAREWAGEEQDEYVSRVSVFDSQSAAVYLTERTDVAFRPFGLDLFDKLVQACKQLRGRLEKEQRSLKPKGISELQAKVRDETAAGKLLRNITSLTDPEAVRTLCALSDDEKIRLRSLERSLSDLQASDPDRLIRELRLRIGRVEALARHLRGVEDVLSSEAVDALFETSSELQTKRAEAARIRALTFGEGSLEGTGSESWSCLWEAAREFSEEHAYPQVTFPATGDDAQCVLCQQDLEAAARARLERFRAFVSSVGERDLLDAKERFAGMRRSLTQFDVQPNSITETLAELAIEDDETASAVEKWLGRAEDRRQAVVLALSESREPGDYPSLDEVVPKLDALAVGLQERLRAIVESKAEDASVRLKLEVAELQDRSVLAEHEDLVLDEIDRKRRLAAYGLCIDDTRSQAITRKSSAITRKLVTEKLRESFRHELARLRFGHVEVELKEAGGREGVLYHQIVLSRAPGVELPKVVSEGEQRCLSIAAFFAELSTAEDPSGIVFDDPVSSLDYRWREAVAQRLVEEARVRQVVVFTHDVVFLLALKELAGDLDVDQADQHVRKLAEGAGVCIAELPWVALRVRKRIGHLRQLLQAAEKLDRQGHKAAYEKEAGVIYGLLREAWERGLEEVLLAGVVERFRPGVQTMQVGVLSDITREDCKAVERAMTKCSKWLPGHDRAPAAPAEMPEPDALSADIEALNEWLGAINRRRR